MHIRIAQSTRASAGPQVEAARRSKATALNVTSWPTHHPMVAVGKQCLVPSVTSPQGITTASTLRPSCRMSFQKIARTSGLMALACAIMTFGSYWASDRWFQIKRGRSKLVLNVGHRRTQLVPLSRPLRGERGAPYVLVEFGDYECPFCRETARPIRDLLQKYRGKLSFCFRNLPLPGHPDAFMAAVVAESTTAPSRFWAVHDDLFSGKGIHSSADVHRVASLHNIAGPTREAIKKVKADLGFSKEMGLRGVPAYFLCGPDGGCYALLDLKKVAEIID